MKKAFTLIELLIVIAIIAILALIAIPNFLEAQARANISRVKADMRSVATAIEAYTVDNRIPPIVQFSNPTQGTMHDGNQWQAWSWQLYWEDPKNHRGCTFSLTTPVAYLTSRPPIDPFAEKVMDSQLAQIRGKASYVCYNVMGQYAAQLLPIWTGAKVVTGPSMAIRFNAKDSRTINISWALASPGPDRSLFDPPTNGTSGNISWCQLDPNIWGQGQSALYDPTNGSVSIGNIWRFSGGTE
jgi:prepilin-type N-terminal cleavage/methylation domain-containing protein